TSCNGQPRPQESSSGCVQRSCSTGCPQSEVRLTVAPGRERRASGLAEEALHKERPTSHLPPAAEGSMRLWAGSGRAGVWLLLGCGSALTGPPGGPDASGSGSGSVGTDAGTDGGSDAGTDGGSDAGTDGGSLAVNPVVQENALPGDPDWRSGGSAEWNELGLYVSTESARAGEAVDVHASSRPGGTGIAEVFRLGSYGGAGARRVWSSGPLSLSPQPPCPPQAGTELVECDWQTTATFPGGQSWLPRRDAVHGRRSDGARAFTPFVVRDGRPAELLLQTTFTTDQAYNGWGGESLYQDNTGLLPSGKAPMVSFNRPYIDSAGLGRFAWRALDFVQFVERAGYDVTYATNLDFLRDGHVLDHVGALVIPGHDEYWPPEERAAVDAAIARGTSLVYFGANGGYWRIRLGPDAHGRPLRTIICFKG